MGGEGIEAIWTQILDYDCLHYFFLLGERGKKLDTKFQYIY